VDPSTGGPIAGEAFRAYATGLGVAFPDLIFDTASHPADGASAQWIMRGINTGAFRGLPPTGKAVTVRGADFFTFDRDGRIATTTGYFDGGAVPATQRSGRFTETTTSWSAAGAATR
jgi:steroid delta-isomerase-like uncharacterized protein